ncbi:MULTISPECIES: phosphatase PAP2 family protein [unclassified Luteococcus]|uniref:phosphatase PAP2 family protein n=1 Tax=unclassified Luteococcus TaxID=2639923 RepID=UPI00313DC88A
MDFSREWRWLRPLLLAAACGFSMLACWRFFVATGRGQMLDTASYLGASIGHTHVADRLQGVLEVVSVGVIALAMLVVAMVAVLRGRWMLALEAATVVACANLSTRVLKYHLLYRPFLLDYKGIAHNSFPSGHTTAAGSAMVAALLVAPRRLRPLVAVLGSGVMMLFGYGTLAAHWHRPSDVVGAYLVCFCWAFGALSLGALRQRMLGRRLFGEDQPALQRPSRLMPVLLLMAGGFALGIAAICAWFTWQVNNIHSEVFTEQFIAYLGGAAGICGVAAAGMAVLLRLVQLQDAGEDQLL